jgi:hypothetical protein
MYRQVEDLRKRGAAVVALVRLFAGVRSRVPREGASIREGRGALGACVTLIACVNADMAEQVAPHGKRSSANFANVRLVACV